MEPPGPYNQEPLDPTDSDLALFETRRANRRLERAGDHEVLLGLQLVGYDVDTPEWKELANALAEYGYGVIMGWLISGIAKRKASEFKGGQGVFGLGKLPDGLQLDADDAHAVAVEVVTVSIDVFRSKTLMNEDPDKRWSPTGGASIKTFFVGRCLMQLPDEWVKFNRDRERELPTEDLLLDRPTRNGIDAESKVVVDDQIGSLLALVPVTTRAMFRLQALGYSIEEIAEILSTEETQITSAKVKTDIYRARNNNRGTTTT